MLPYSLSNFEDQNTQVRAAELYDFYYHKYGNVGKAIALTRKLLKEQGYFMGEIKEVTPLVTKVPQSDFVKKEKEVQPEQPALFNDLKYY